MFTDKELPVGWKETTLSEVWKAVTGKTPSRENPEDWWDFKDFITPTDIKNDSKYIENTTRKISSLGMKRFSKMTIPKNSVIVTCIGSDMWKVVINKNDCLTNQQINSLILNNKFNVDFTYYLLKNSYLKLRSRADGGSTMPILNKSNFESLKFLIPPLSEQIAIAWVLTALDDKIELLRWQNKTLEQLGQTIFHEWFGRYSVGEPESLPDGWRVGRLGDEFDISIGRTPPRVESQRFSDTPIGKKWISIKDIGNTWTYIFNTSEYLTDEAVEKFNIPIIPENTTILSFKMTVGKLTITTEEMLSNEAIAHLKLKDNSVLSSEFVYSYLQKLDFNSLWSTSSIVTAINSTMIKNLEIIVPNEETLKSFDQSIYPIFNKIKYNVEQIQSLAHTRDELLPRLMSGEVRVEF